MTTTNTTSALQSSQRDIPSTPTSQRRFPNSSRAGSVAGGPERFPTQPSYATLVGGSGRFTTKPSYATWAMAIAVQNPVHAVTPVTATPAITATRPVSAPPIFSPPSGFKSQAEGSKLLDTRLGKVKKIFPSNYQIAFSLAAAQHGWRDKVLKEAILCCDFSRLIMKDFNGDSATIERLGEAKDALVKARFGFGLLNVFDSAIPDVIKATQNAYHHAQMMSNEEYVAEKQGSNAFKKDALEYPTICARVIGFLVSAMKVVERICFIICFGIVNPVRFANDCAKGGLGNTVKTIGKTFSYFWMGVHLASFAGNLCEFIRKGFLVDPEGSPESRENARVNDEMMPIQKWSEEMKELTMKLTENICDLLCDIIVIAALVTAVNGYVTVSLSLFATTVGLYRLWHKTANTKIEIKA